MIGATLTTTNPDLDREAHAPLGRRLPVEPSPSDSVERARAKRDELIVSLGGLVAGSRCEVRSSFTGRWTGGFEIAEVRDDGHMVRRLSDGWVLPARFRSQDCRPA